MDICPFLVLGLLMRLQLMAGCLGGPLMELTADPSCTIRHLGMSCNSSPVASFILCSPGCECQYNITILLPKRRKNSSYRSSQRACANHPHYDRLPESSMSTWGLQSGHEHTGTALAAVLWTLSFQNIQGQLDVNLSADRIQPLGNLY